MKMPSKNETMSPLISIIVPVYNTDAYSFSRCVESLAVQTYRQIEIIVIDDGSELKKAQSYIKALKQYTNISYTRQNHSGVSAARNLGLKKSTGEYVMFVDSDDYLDIECCNEAMSVVTNETDFVYFSYIKHYSSHSKQVNFADSPYNISVLGTSCMKLYKKSSIENIYFDETLRNAEDIEFNFRAFQKIQNPKLLQKHLYHYWIHRDSSVRKFREDYISQYLKTINKIQSDLQKKPLCRELYNSYYDFLAIAYLMILLNFVYHIENKKPRKVQLKQLEQQDFVQDLFFNYDKLSLPLTRKLIVFFGKHKFYALITVAIRMKQELDR